MCRLIGIVGPLGHGKTTIAQMLVDQGYVRTRMADTLKNMLLAFGLCREQVDGNLKEEPSELLCGKTPRYAMQTLGHEWSRVGIGDDIWVRAMQKRLVDIWVNNPEADIVIDDIRYENEIQMVLGNGGEIWRVVDPRKLEKEGSFARFMRLFNLKPDFTRIHASETYWQRIIPHADIVNDRGIAQLREKVAMAMIECDQRERRQNGGKTIREITRSGKAREIILEAIAS